MTEFHKIRLPLWDGEDPELWFQLCEDTFFLAGISGERPPRNKKDPRGKGILLTFDNTIYSYKDPNAPGIAESFNEVSKYSCLKMWYFR